MPITRSMLATPIVLAMPAIARAETTKVEFYFAAVTALLGSKTAKAALDDAQAGATRILQPFQNG